MSGSTKSLRTRQSRSAPVATTSRHRSMPKKPRSARASLPRPLCRDDVTSQGVFAGAQRPGRGGEDDVRAALRRAGQTDLRIAHGRLTPPGTALLNPTVTVSTLSTRAFGTTLVSTPGATRSNNRSRLQLTRTRCRRGLWGRPTEHEETTASSPRLLPPWRRCWSGPFPMLWCPAKDSNLRRACPSLS